MSASQEDRLERAANWFVLSRDSDFTPAQRTEMEAWLEQDPANRQAFAEICQTWTSVDDLQQVYASRPNMANMLISGQAGKRSFFSWLFGPQGRCAVALALLLILCLPLIQELISVPNIQEYSTRTGEQKDITLEDGSLLQMNVATRLTVKMDRAIRRVTLGQGEVFFNVASDPQRPFEVITPGGMVRVLGTAFNIKARNGEVAIDVKQGRVKVADAPSSRRGKIQAHQVVLVADQGVNIGSNGRLMALRPSRIEEVLAWQQGKVTFKNTPVAKVLKELEMYHQVTIEFPATTGNRTISGAFYMRDLKQALSLICLAASLQIKIKSNTYIVLKEAG